VLANPEPISSQIPNQLPTDYQNFIHKSRYARFIDELGRRENWDETVTRYFDYFEEELLEHHGHKVSPTLRSELMDAVANLQVMPSMLHRNLVPKKSDPNDLYAAGIGGRFKLSKRVSFNIDYHYVINQGDSSVMHNPLSIGFDLETGGHVFQLHFTNSKGMNERAFLAATEYKWGDGDIFFGFNISRSSRASSRFLILRSRFAFGSGTVSVVSILGMARGVGVFCFCQATSVAPMPVTRSNSNNRFVLKVVDSMV